ncbi:MAG: autotransporter domain-containing protein [Maritimibacter sp.]
MVFSLSPLQAADINGTSETVIGGGGGTISSPWNIYDHLYVGRTTTGDLTISNGGYTGSETGYIGFEVGSTGAVTVTGSGSEWVNSSDLFVGLAGGGTLAVSDGGTVSSTGGFLGYGAGSTGNATISGAGSSWSTQNPLFVGLSGTGDLTLTDGGLVSVGEGSKTVALGLGETGTGTLNIGAAAGSAAAAAGTLQAGKVTLSTTSDRLVFNHTDGAYSFGPDITGFGGILQYSGTTTLAGDMTGFTGNIYADGGRLAVADSSQVHDGNAYIGYNTGSNAKVLVSGGSSVWTNTGALSVGADGTGTMVVENGGTVTSATGTLGQSSTGFGIVSITGAGSSWNITGGLDIGLNGVGQLTLADAGLLTVGGGSGTVDLAYNGGAGGELVIGAARGESAIAAGSLNAGSVDMGDGDARILFNHTDSAYSFGADINGSGQIILDAGTTMFAGDMAGYTGALMVNNGTLAITSATPAHSREGIIGLEAGTSGTAVIDGDGADWDMDYGLSVGLGGRGDLAVQNGGTITMANGNSFLGYSTGSTGAATVEGTGSRLDSRYTIHVGYYGTGELTLADGGTASVNSGAGSLYLGRWAGSTGTLNIGAASGDAAVGAGTVEATALTFGAGTGTLVFNHTDADYDFAPDITGAGTISHLAGVTNLTGNNSGFSGTTSVSGGLLNVDGMLGGTLTLAGGSLGGNGTLGTLNVASGTLAPGHSVGTLNVGDLSSDAGSTYAVELNDGGFVAGTNNDFINATGTINITGGTVHVAPENGTDAGETYSTGSYTIATAAGGVSGTFDSITDDYLFLDFTLGYDASNIILTSEQVAAFQNVALTPNQIAAAAAAETLVSGNAVYDALLGVATEEEARAGFDALSGEAYATMASGTLQASRYPREAMLGQDSGSGLNRWASTYGGMMSLGSDGNAAAARAYAGGLIAGIDKGFSTGFGTAWLGASLHGGMTRLSVADRNTTISSNDLGAGIYGGAEMGGADIRFGADYTLHQISSSRDVSIGGFSDHLTASYTGGTAQIFGEIRHSFDLGTSTLTPFAGAAYLYDWTEGVTEAGGAAALNVAAKSNTALITTLGATVERDVTLNGQTATLSGTLGWRHAFGATPSIDANFTGGNSFSVNGAPIARDALILGAGVSFAMETGAMLDLSYSGEIGSTSSDHKLAAALTMSF